MKKKYIYLIGVFIIVCVIILIICFSKKDSIRLYDKYSARIGISYNDNSYSSSFDYDGVTGRIIYEDKTVYMDSKGVYYSLDNDYYKYETDINYTSLSDVISKFKILEKNNEEYRCEASSEFLDSLFIKGTPSDCYLSIDGGYVKGVSVNFDKGNVYISFKKLDDDFSVSMLGYFDEKSKIVHDNILEIK